MVLAEGEGIEPLPFRGSPVFETGCRPLGTALRELAEGARIELARAVRPGYGLASRRIPALPPFRSDCYSMMTLPVAPSIAAGVVMMVGSHGDNRRSSARSPSLLLPPSPCRLGLPAAELRASLVVRENLVYEAIRNNRNVLGGRADRPCPFAA